MKIALFTLGYMYLFWVLYIFIMAVYRAYLAKRLTVYMIILCVPFVIVGGAMDVLCNLTLATVLCLELPEEWLVTQRFIRYLKMDKATLTGIDKWRYALAKFVCDNLLDVFDPDGDHCEDLSSQQASTTPILKETE